MATEFIIKSEQNPDRNVDTTKKGAAIEYSFDFSPWADDNSDIETVTWTLKYGQAAISDEALSDNVATALVTFAEGGKNLIEVKAEAENGEIYVALLEVLARDPEQCSDDYGMAHG